MIRITSHPEGCVLAVHAQPGARRSRIVGEHAGALKLAITVPAQDSKANQALIEFLRDSLGVKRSAVELIAGQSARQKRFLIRGIAKDELEALIARLLPP